MKFDGKDPVEQVAHSNNKSNNKMSAAYRPYRDEEGLDGLDNDQLTWSDHEPGSIQIYEKTTEDLPFTSNKRLLFSFIAVCLLSLICGFLVGYFGHSEHTTCVPTISVALHSVRDEDSTIAGKLLNLIDKESIRSIVREFAAEPRIPGSPHDQKVAKQIHNYFLAHSLDRVEIKNYSVLLSEPDGTEPNFLQIFDGDDNNRQILYNSLNYDNARTHKPPPFCAYSPPADLISSEVVFVNYGRLSDFQTLFSYNISLQGKILIAKQLLLSPDEQLDNAQEVNASALLLYPDPAHYNPPNFKQKPFPDSIWMPSDGVRRDSLLWNMMGDPQTPGYPSTHYAFRMPLESIRILPRIPVQPISYSVAQEIMRLLGGAEVPETWRGGLNATYRFGPNFQNKSHKLRLKINNRLVNKTIQNVIGFIYGRVEPDRYVIIGSHRDSWVDGAVDSAAGTGVLLELSKAFGGLVQKDWRPRRTIMFCSWGAEEYNLIGSTEWIEENKKILHNRAIAYINSDIIVIGNGSVSVAASPLLYNAMFNATKTVPNPGGNVDQPTVYDKWLTSFPLMRNKSGLLFSNNPRSSHSVNDEFSFDYEGEFIFKQEKEPIKIVEYGEPGSILHNYARSSMIQVRPKVRQLDMRSVYAPFFNLVGIPTAEVTYISMGKNSTDPILSYPLIHTQYDTAELIDKYIDPSYEYHKAVAQVLAELTRDLADSLFIPFNLLDYAQVLKDLYLTLKMHTKNVFTNQGVNLDFLESAIHNFTQAAIRFHGNQDKLDFRDPMAIRRVNDQLLLLERAFIDPNGLPRNPMKRHLVLSPSDMNAPYGDMFPGLLDEFSILIYADYSNHLWSWDIIRAHFSIVVYTIQSAADMLKEMI